MTKTNLQNLWDAAKAILRGKFIAIQAFLKTQEKSQINNTLLNNQDHWRNQRGNQKIPSDKWQWKHDEPKPMGCSKSSLRGKFTAIQSALKKQ